MEEKLNFKKMNGLLPVITRDYKTKEILMLGFMNKQAYKRTLKRKKVWYYSRTRKRLWLKGEKSGNYQIVKRILTDCDNDSLLIDVKQIGKVCHLNKKSCFHKKIL